MFIISFINRYGDSQVLFLAEVNTRSALIIDPTQPETSHKPSMSCYPSCPHKHSFHTTKNRKQIRLACLVKVRPSPHNHRRRHPHPSLHLTFPLLLLLLLCLGPALDIILVLDGHALGHVVDLVYTDQARGKLEHVVTKRNNDELSVLRALLDVVSHDRNLWQSASLPCTANRASKPTFRKSNAASISSMTYSGVGL